MQASVRRLRERDGEDGRILVLGIGLVALLLTMIVGGIDATAILLARMRVYDAADAAAVSAADSIDRTALYHNGVGEGLSLTDETVGQAAMESLALQKPPPHVTSWAISSGTGTSDGTTAVVRVSASVRPPFTGGLMSIFGQSVHISVESHARAEVR